MCEWVLSIKEALRTAGFFWAFDPLRRSGTRYHPAAIPQYRLTQLHLRRFYALEFAGDLTSFCNEYEVSSP